MPKKLCPCSRDLQCTLSPWHQEISQSPGDFSVPTAARSNDLLPTTDCCLWTITPSKQLNRPGQSPQTHVQFYASTEHRSISLKTTNAPTPHQKNPKKHTRKVCRDSGGMDFSSTNSRYVANCQNRKTANSPQQALSLFPASPPKRSCRQDHLSKC